MAIASVDASQCYNQIQHTAASVSCQAWGVPLVALTSLLTTIQAMNIHLCTAYGDTDEAILNNPDDPFQGVLQGNGASPVIWLAISAIFGVLPTAEWFCNIHTLTLSQHSHYLSGTPLCR